MDKALHFVAPIHKTKEMTNFFDMIDFLGMPDFSDPNGYWNRQTHYNPFEIEYVIFNDPATIVYWKDGTKTVVKCNKEQGDVFSKEVGLVTAVAKKAYGNRGKYNDILRKWINEDEKV